MATKPAIPCRTRGWSSTARIRIELVSVFMTPSLSATLFQRTFQITMTGWETSHKPRRQECSTQPQYRNRDHSRPSAYHPRLRRVRAYRAIRNVLGDRLQLEPLDRYPFRHPARAAVSALGHNEFPLRCVAPERAGMNSAALRTQSGKLRHAGSDSDSAPYLLTAPGRQRNCGWFHRKRVLLRKTLWQQQGCCFRSWMSAILVPHPGSR